MTKIEELEELEESLDHLESLNELWHWETIHRNDESEFKSVQEFLKKHGRNYKKCQYGT